ncbi:phospholipase C [Paraburkholderia guartelaensis]|uniref:phospholipase C n=1 Tax=Paraburkholderia guartelaensis TaxID=2546446 RepID=UPI002AB709A5|nr:alkaline phosphatase family protein [Paraburkholderia guartelaensis]
MHWRHMSLCSLIAAECALTIAWGASDGHDVNRLNDVRTATPIKHLVVIYGENVSFDHYFATYPHAANPSREPAFNPRPGTPSVNGLSGALLSRNPNSANPANGAGASNPFRIDRAQAATADQDHAYTAEQQAYNNGAADLFPKYTGRGNSTSDDVGATGKTGQVMGYFDGNTVTALWNYAQRFAMSDNAWSSTYGPSTPGALEVISGQTNGMKAVLTTRKPSVAGSYYVNDGQGGFTLINDVDPAFDSCSSKRDTVMMTGRNIGDLLNARNITWGGFMGGFNLETVNSNGTTACRRSSLSAVVGSATVDYIPHHNWFQYYASTSNPRHLRPSSIEAIGHSLEKNGQTPDPANHQYDSDDFFDAVNAGNFPAVSFLKAPAFEDGHAGYSDPLDEQAFVAKVLNFLQRQPDWANTAVIVTWDDSDGWYDHAYAIPSSASYDAVADQLNGPGTCGSGPPQYGLNGKPVNGRCGPGTRIPFLVISPWAKENFVDHTLIDQSSIVRFVEDNWLDGQRIGGGSFDGKAGSIMGMFDFSRRGEERKLFLDPGTGLEIDKPPKI